MARTESKNTPKFRAAFVRVFEPEKNDLSGNMEYSLVALFAPGTDLSVLKGMCQEACEKKWGPDTSKWPDNLKQPFRDQSEKVKKDKDTGAIIKDENGQPLLMDGFEHGGKFVTLKTMYQPTVVDEQVQTVMDQTKFYSGVYAIASVHAHSWGPNKGGCGVSFGLDMLQRVGDGEALGGGGRIRPEDAFKPAVETPAGQSEAPAGGSAASMFD